MTSYREHLLSKAHHHRWAFDRLREVVDEMADETYHADAGVAYETVHDTLNHILLVDRIWYHRLREETFEFDSLSQELESQREKLWLKLLARADHFIDMLETMPVDYVESTFVYADMRDVQRRLQRGQALTHVFDHGTHHRGEITAALSMFGYSSPDMTYASFALEDAHSLEE